MKTTVLVKKVDERHWRVPPVTAYTDENHLRTLLQDGPELLPGLDASRPVVLVHEFPVSTEGVDLVGVSPTGALTVVEVKLHYNQEMKRTIVGQLFAYAAGLWGMSYAEFDEAWQSRIHPFNMNNEEWERRKRPPLFDDMAAAVAEHGLSWDPEGFSTAVEANLKAGRYTLVFAVDEITSELERIVEYLSEHTAPEVNVIALEVGYLRDGDTEVLVPHTYGLEMAERKTSADRAPQPWDRAKFSARLRLTTGDWAVPIVESLLDWADAARLETWYGTGAVQGTLNIGMRDPSGRQRPFFTCISDRTIHFKFIQLESFPPFDEAGSRLDLLRRLNGIEGVSIKEVLSDASTYLHYEALRPDGSLRQFTDVLDWAVGLIRTEARHG